MDNDSVPAKVCGYPEQDTRAIRAGAVEYVTCSLCGSRPGEACKLPSGSPVPNFAHISRRWEYIEGRGIFFREPTRIPPEIWLCCKQGRHAECKPHPPECKCHPPDPCECSCHKSSNVDDLLG